MWKWNTFSTADHCQWTGELKYNNNRLCFTWAPAQSQVNTAELFVSVGVGATLAPVSACLVSEMAAVYEHCPRPDGWGCNWSGLLSRRKLKSIELLYKITLWLPYSKITFGPVSLKKCIVYIQYCSKIKDMFWKKKKRLHISDQ